MSSDFALDVGTAWTRVHAPGRGVVLEEPTLAAVDLDSGKMVAFGAAAKRLVGRSSGRVGLLRPVRHGEFLDLGVAEAAVSEVLRRAAGRAGRGHPRVLACVPSGATGVQRRVFERALHRAGARRTALLEHPIASAVGAGLKIEQAEGSMVVDVGAGTAEVGVLALGGLVCRASIPIAGRDLDEAVRSLCQRQLELLVDWDTAEALKIAVGVANDHYEEVKAEVFGRDAGNGRARTVVVSRSEVRAAIAERLDALLRRVADCLAGAPPDLLDDLLRRGLYLAGGTSLLPGFAERVADATGLAVHLVGSPTRCAIIGAGRFLRRMASLPG